MAALNCRPGDLARIVNMDPRLSLNDKIVRLRNLPPFSAHGEICWHLDEPLLVKLPTAGVNMSTGDFYFAGQVLRSSFMADAYLRRIDAPSDDAVDEMVKLVGPAPMTLTEVLEHDEVAHG